MLNLIPKKRTNGPQLYCKILGSKNINLKDGYLKCFLKFGEKDLYTTYTKYDVQYWDEEFIFNIESIEMLVLTIEVYSCREDNDNDMNYIGEINLPMPLLQSMKIVRNYYDIRDPVIQNVKKGELELILFISHKKSLNNYIIEFETEIYQQYFELITKSPYNLFKLLYASSEQKNYDRVCSSIVSVFVYTRKEFELFEYLLKKEIEETTKTTILFRANSVAMRTISSYARLVSENYLKEVLTPFIGEILKDTSEYEIRIDKIKKNSVKKLEKNLKNINRISNLILDAIIKSSDKIPNEIKVVCTMVAKYVDLKFEGFSPNAIGGLIFLRLICPTISVPKSYRIIETQIKTEDSKALVYVAKVLQNLASNTKFHEKDLVPLNSFIENRYSDMLNFLGSISNYDIDSYEKPKKYPVSLSQLVLELDSLDKFFLTYLGRMEKNLEKTEFSDYKNDFEILKKYLDFVYKDEEKSSPIDFKTMDISAIKKKKGFKIQKFESWSRNQDNFNEEFKENVKTLLLCIERVSKENKVTIPRITKIKMIKLMDILYQEQKEEEILIDLFKNSADLRDLVRIETGSFFVKEFGEELVDKYNLKMKTETVLREDDYVFLYFGNYSSKECEKYQTRIINFANDYSEKLKFDIIYVSCDIKEEHYNHNRKFIPFFSVPFESKSLRVNLSTKYQIKIIPSLVLVDRSGLVLTTDRNWPYADRVGHYFPWKGDLAEKKDNCICF